MKTFTIQASHPTESRVAVSDWKESTYTIKATTREAAIKRVHKICEARFGTWMILDAWEGEL